MRYCKHTQWLGLAMRDGDILLQGTDRLQRILEDLPDPDKQKPSLLVFIGNRAKATAIQELVKSFAPQPRYYHESYYRFQEDDELEPRENLHGKRGHGEIHLHIHPLSVFSRPVLLAEGDFPTLERPKRELLDEKCHETMTKQLESRTLTAKPMTDSANEIYFRLLSPFTDVFCFFATDLGGFGPIVQRLASWLDLGQPSTLPKSTRPRILIVTEGDSSNDESLLRVFKQMLSEETTIDVSYQFSEIRLVSLRPRRDLSNKARHRKLKEHLLNISDQVRAARLSSRTLFSGRHFIAFFRYAFHHLATTRTDPFDFITASRVDNVVRDDLQNHLENFLRQINSPRQVLSFAVPVIASSILLDSYPTDMHFFNPVEVFRTLYKSVFSQVCRTGVLVHESSTHVILPSVFMKILQDELAEQFEAFVSCSVSSVVWHRNLLAEFKQDWLNLFSDKTCFICQRQRPQYALPCQHIICENCVRAFGAPIDAWSFELYHCFLCGQDASGFRVKVKPPTATIRLLSIDGGGARGVIPLVFLQALQEEIGLDYPVQENFDMAFGTSSGGISDLALCINGWPVEDCLDKFERFAKLVFYKRGLSCLQLLLQFRAVLLSFITDSIYPARNLEASLKEVFGTERKILDHSYATANGIKTGITVSSMEPEPFIFTNYNGCGERQDQSYGVLHGNVLVWEIARSTSAAPGFFSAKSIVGLGKFQDGGLKHNNPIELALKEVEALYAADSSAKRSAMKVSLGTGLAKRDSNIHGSSWWRDMWVFRLCRALWSSMDSQEKSDAIHRKELRSVQEEMKTGRGRRRGEYFRFNVRFTGREPRMDDTSKIPELKALACEAVLQSSEIRRLARCLISKLFVYELESEPRKENGRYLCTGYILCRHRAGSAAFDALLKRLTSTSAKFVLRGRVLPGVIRDRTSLGRDGNFKKRVCFDVTSKQELVSLCLREGDGESFNISGSPFSVDWLVEAQGLHTPFGRPDKLGKRKRFRSENKLRGKRQRCC